MRHDGSDATPPSAKAQGMLALLAVAPGRRRPRLWLQDKLWSDQPPENGSASLRQTLHRLRLAVGGGPDWLVTRAGWVALDPQRVQVAAEPDPEAWDGLGPPPDFCEGLELPDPEFAAWIQGQRRDYRERLAAARRSGPAAAAGPPPAATAETTVLLVAPAETSDPPLQALGDHLCAEIAASVARLGGAEVRAEGVGAVAQLPRDAVRLRLNACRFGGRALILLQLSEPESGRILWSSSRSLELGEDSPAALEAFVADTSSAAALELGRAPLGTAAARPGYRAVGDALAFDGRSFGDGILVEAARSGPPRPAVHLAWAAQMRIFSILERRNAQPEEDEREARDLAEAALSGDPLNPVVNAVAAEAALYVENRPVKAAQLAAAAIERGHALPMTHSILSQALARLGRAQEAHAAALHALKLSALLPNRALLHVRTAVTAICCGRYDEALDYAQTAHELAPSFRPPLRFLAALHFHRRDEAAAAEALRRLKALEPDFSLDLMADVSYPVSSLRGTPLIAVTRSTLI